MDYHGRNRTFLLEYKYTFQTAIALAEAFTKSVRYYKIFILQKLLKLYKVLTEPSGVAWTHTKISRNAKQL